MKIGYGQKKDPAPEREYFCGQPAKVYIQKQKAYAPLVREGIYEGWVCWDSTIWPVLRKPEDAYNLIPLSLITRNSLAKLGGVPKSAVYELGNMQRGKD